jgi:hypothetical protein
MGARAAGVVALAGRVGWLDGRWSGRPHATAAGEIASCGEVQDRPATETAAVGRPVRVRRPDCGISSVENGDGQLEVVPGAGDDVEAGVDRAQREEAGAGDPRVVVGVEDRDVVARRPVRDLSDLVREDRLDVPVSARGSGPGFSRPNRSAIGIVTGSRVTRSRVSGLSSMVAVASSSPMVSRIFMDFSCCRAELDRGADAIGCLTVPLTMVLADPVAGPSLVAQPAVTGATRAVTATTAVARTVAAPHRRTGVRRASSSSSVAGLGGRTVAA